MTIVYSKPARGGSSVQQWKLGIVNPEFFQKQIVSSRLIVGYKSKSLMGVLIPG